MKQYLSIILFVLALVACGKNDPIAVTEGGNTTQLQGMALDSLGKPVVGALVRIRPQGYVSPLTLPAPLAKFAITVSADSVVRDSVYTDSLGHFVLDSLVPGAYSVEWSYQDSAMRLASWQQVTLDTGKNDLGIDTLKKASRVRGNLPDSLRTLGYRYVQIIGLERLVQVNDSTGEFAFEDLPEGLLRFRFVGDDSTSQFGRILELEIDSDGDHEIGEVEGLDDDDESVIIPIEPEDPEDVESPEDTTDTLN